jgi:hypothetical protein
VVLKKGGAPEGVLVKFRIGDDEPPDTGTVDEGGPFPVAGEALEELDEGLHAVTGTLSTRGMPDDW